MTVIDVFASIRNAQTREDGQLRCPIFSVFVFYLTFLTVISVFILTIHRLLVIFSFYVYYYSTH